MRDWRPVVRDAIVASTTQATGAPIVVSYHTRLVRKIGCLRSVSPYGKALRYPCGPASADRRKLRDTLREQNGRPVSFFGTAPPIDTIPPIEYSRKSSMLAGSAWCGRIAARAVGCDWLARNLGDRFGYRNYFTGEERQPRFSSRLMGFASTFRRMTMLRYTTIV